MSGELKLSSIRPVVRYVDADQAVIDTHFQTAGLIPHATAGFTGEADVHITIESQDGFHDEGQTRAPVRDGEGSVRFEVVCPQRWWPAGMGDQPLYTLTLSLVNGSSVVDQRTATVGLTSVRRNKGEDSGDVSGVIPGFLVNGQHCEIHSVIMVDRVDEHTLLPATGDSLLMVRDHYGPELLYEAADRAGVLLVQSVPISAQGKPSEEVAKEVDRLAAHPCLAGWFVGHLGDVRDKVKNRIKALDPTHTVFEHFPKPGTGVS
jgi:beta-galactosidase/beta-glucuronidase